MKSLNNGHRKDDDRQTNLFRVLVICIIDLECGALYWVTDPKQPINNKVPRQARLLTFSMDVVGQIF